MSNTIEFKANRFHFLKIHLLGGFFACILGSIFFRSLYSFFGFMTVCLITAIPILFLDTKKYDIILKPNEIEGPIRIKTKKKRISVPYEQIDFDGSKKQSFFQGGYIAIADGSTIWIYNLYFNIKQTNLLFKELQHRMNNQSLKGAEDK